MVIHGETDRRIRVGVVHSAVEGMRTGGVSVSYIEYPDEDHFLFLARLDDVAGWLELSGKEV